MSIRRRIALALLIGLVSGLVCAWRVEARGWVAGDFTYPWRAANSLLEGHNPYLTIQPTGQYPFQAFFYYPLTAALAALPFAPLPPLLAAGLFFGLSAALLAFALLRHGWRYLALFLSAPFWVAAAVAQWSPLILAAALLPGLEWLMSCKPNLGAALFLARPTWRSVILGGAFLLLSWVVLPGWPLDWLEVGRGLEGHPPPALILPFGPLLLLALLRWREENGRLLLGLALFPQLIFFYDQLPLWLLPPNFKWGLVYAGLSWLAYFAWRAAGSDPTSPAMLSVLDQLILGLVYVPALGMVFEPEIRAGLARLRRNRA